MAEDESISCELVDKGGYGASNINGRVSIAVDHAGNNSKGSTRLFFTPNEMTAVIITKNSNGEPLLNSSQDIKPTDPYAYAETVGRAMKNIGIVCTDSSGNEATPYISPDAAWNLIQHKGPLKVMVGK